VQKLQTPLPIVSPSQFHPSEGNLVQAFPVLDREDGSGDVALRQMKRPDMTGQINFVLLDL
jgi:hypothetical protein